ncbi:actin-binding protein IPP-like [Artemia franciscana]|uniref:actin-binding protein IPP-like n=1 Tax=Artemia franciscana TaxID=6661 RepID=UPI0032DB604D
MSATVEIPLTNYSSHENMSGVKNYSDKSYPGNVLNKLFKLWKHSSFCDVTVVVEGTYFKTHKLLLAASSSYFHAMFLSDLVEKQLDVINLQSITSDIFQMLLDFVYTGEISVTRANVQELIVAADMLGLDEVVVCCTDFLIEEFHPANCLGIYRFAEDHNFKILSEAAFNFVCQNFVEVVKEEEFLELPKHILLTILASEDLRIDEEYQVFDSAIRWIKSNLDERRQYVFEILIHVRLPLISTRALQESVDCLKDISLKVALKSVQKDVEFQKGSLVTLSVEPRKRAKKHIFLIGGCKRKLIDQTRSWEYTYDSVLKFDTFSQVWTMASPMKIGRILPGIAHMNGRIFVIGGEQESQILANGEVYDVNDDKWTEIACLQKPRCEFGLCTMDNLLYALGGWVGEDIGGSIERYDPVVNEWKLIGEMPEPRFSMGVVAHDGMIYVVGGCTRSRRHIKDMIAYNPVIGEWVSLAPMQVSRSQMGVAVLNNYLYVVGGINRHSDMLKSVERYCFEENKWEEMPSMSVGRSSPAVAVSNGLLYVIGGDQTLEVNFYRAQITVSDVEVYDPYTGQWSFAPPLPDSRSEAGAVVA